MSRRRGQRDERGSMTIEAAVLAPALILILGTTIGLGRLAMADNTINQVTHDAARIASISRTGEEARSGATAAAHSTLAAQGIRCSDLDLEIDTSGFAAQVGTPSTVTVTLRCTVPLADQFLPFAPGNKTLTATASRAIDTYRER